MVISRFCGSHFCNDYCMVVGDYEMQFGESGEIGFGAEAVKWKPEFVLPICATYTEFITWICKYCRNIGEAYICANANILLVILNKTV